MKPEPFQTGRVMLVAFSHFVHDVYTSFLSPLLPLIIEKLSLTLGQAGLLSTVMQVPALLNPVIGLFADNRGLARWLVILCAGTLSDRIGRQRVLFWVLMVAPIAILTFVFTDGFIKIAMVGVAGFTVLSTTPVMLALVQENAKMNPSAANGLFMMASFFVRSVAVFLAGIIGDLAGLDNMFIVSAVIGFFAIPFLLKLDHS